MEASHALKDNDVKISVASFVNLSKKVPVDGVWSLEDYIILDICVWASKKNIKYLARHVVNVVNVVHSLAASVLRKMNGFIGAGVLRKLYMQTPWALHLNATANRRELLEALCNPMTLCSTPNPAIEVLRFLICDQSDGHSPCVRMDIITTVCDLSSSITMRLCPERILDNDEEPAVRVRAVLLLARHPEARDILRKLATYNLPTIVKKAIDRANL